MGYRSTFFSCFAAKIFVSFELRVVGRGRSTQNPEPARLIGKILRNKELASDSTQVESRAGANSKKVSARIFPILRVAFSSVKVVRHMSACGRLWKRSKSLEVQGFGRAKKCLRG